MRLLQQGVGEWLRGQPHQPRQMQKVVAVATRSQYRSGQPVVSRIGHRHPADSEQVGRNKDKGA